jgi:hypothetical protein
VPAVVFDLVTRDRSFSRGLDRASKKASGFHRAMGRVGSAAAGALAGGAVLAGVKRVIDAGSDLNETVNKTGLAFGRNAGQIQAWAKGSAKSMGLPKQAALEGASSFGLLLSKLGVGAGQTATMSKAMVQLAVDLGSVHNADPTQIIEAQTAAFRGEYDSLQRFVPAINAAAVETEALRQTGKANAKQLTDSEKAQAVYRLMLKQTTKEQGDFARTANESANKGKILAARVKDMQANLGTLLLPAVTAAANALGDLGDWVEKNQKAAATLGATIVAVTGFVLAWNVATKVAAAVQGVVRGATLAWAAAQKVLNFVLAANPIGLVITAIALLAAGLVLAYKKSETFRKIVDGAFDAVVASGKAMWSLLRPIFAFLVRTWLQVAEGIVRGASIAFGWVPGVGPKLRAAAKRFSEFKDSVNRALNNIHDEPVNVRFKGTFTPPKGFSAHAIVGAQRGMRVPGFGGGDIFPAMLEPGEAVVPKQLVRTAGFRAWAGANRIPGFQAGGLAVAQQMFRPGSVARVGNRYADEVGDRVAANMARKFRLSIPAGMGLGGASGRGGWQWQMAVLRSVFPGLALISGYRPGAITATGNRSYHGFGRAVDIPPRMDVFNWIRGLFGKRTKELIFSPAGGRQVWNGRPHLFSGITRANHWDHIHWAYDKGGWLPPGLSLAYNGTGRPERVLGPRETSRQEVHVHLHGDVYGDRRALVEVVRAGIRDAQRRSGVPAASQLR